MKVQAIPSINIPITFRGQERLFGFKPSLWTPPDGKECGTSTDYGDCDYVYKEGETDPIHFCEPEVLFIEGFIEGLRLVDGGFDGQPFVLLDWLKTTVEIVFGMKIWDDTAIKPNYYRLIQEVFGSVTRGQGKSTFLEAMMCWFLFDYEKGAEGCFAQQTREETLKKIAAKAQMMMETSPSMGDTPTRWVASANTPGGRDRFTRGEGVGEVSLRLVTPVDPKSAKGYRFSFGVFDEIGFMRSNKAEFIIEESIKKSCVEPDPLWFLFSTQSPDPTHYQRRKSARALEVQNQPYLNPRMYPILYISDATVNIHDPKVWWDLGPFFNLGLLPKSLVYQEHDEAVLDPALLNIFARERCGYAGDYSVRFMMREDWEKCAVDGGRRKMLNRMKGKTIYCGCDFSEMSDLSAFVLMAVEPDGTVLVCAWHFIPRGVVEKLDALTRGKVQQWISAGWLEVIEEGKAMPARVAERCLDIIEPVKDDVARWGFDGWHAESAAIIWRNAGWGHDNVNKIAQGANLNAAIKEAAKCAELGNIAHLRDPVLEYCVMSATKEADTKDPDKIRLVKLDRSAAAERIDGAVAWMTAWQTKIAAESFDSRHEKKPSWRDAKGGVVSVP